MTEQGVVHTIDGLLAEEYCNKLYEHLVKTIKWENGPRTRVGYTRKALALKPGDSEAVETLVKWVIPRITKKPYIMVGIYLNYYENGNMWTPNHKHTDTHQMVISLGAPRTLKIKTTNFKMKNGSIALFAHDLHGVPREPEIKEGRISIAVFLLP